MISKLGKKAELGVIDIKKLLRVHPDDFELLGITIDGGSKFFEPDFFSTSQCKKVEN
jgi:hypothetical protein